MHRGVPRKRHEFPKRRDDLKVPAVRGQWERRHIPRHRGYNRQRRNKPSVDRNCNVVLARPCRSKNHDMAVTSTIMSDADIEFVVARRRCSTTPGGSTCPTWPPNPKRPRRCGESGCFVCGRCECSNRGSGSGAHENVVTTAAAVCCSSNSYNIFCTADSIVTAAALHVHVSLRFPVH